MTRACIVPVARSKPFPDFFEVDSWGGIYLHPIGRTHAHHYESYDLIKNFDSPHKCPFSWFFILFNPEMAV
jgi:hypothetical protein